VARLSAERPRGPPNLAFWRRPTAVPCCLPVADGRVAIDAALPEGVRPLMLSST